MILAREQIQLVVNRQRTLLLMPRGDSDVLPPHLPGQLLALRSAVGHAALCRVIVTHVSDVALAELTDVDARQLGCQSLTELTQAWIADHGRWVPGAHAWRIAVEPASTAPRLLRPQAGHHGRRALLGYTSDSRQAMPDEPEAVDELYLAGQRRSAHRTEHQRFEALLAQRERLALDERLRRACADAEARGVSIDRQLHVIRQRLANIERQIYRPADRLAS